MQYRIYWKNKDGGRYATEKELSIIHITPSGQVKLIETHNFIEYRSDITDQVVVEQWIGAFDNQSIPPKKIYAGDKLLVGGEDFDSRYNGKDEEVDEDGEYVDVEEYIVEWCGDEQYPAFDLRPVPGSDYQFSCDSNGISHILAIGCRIKVVGTIHDESEASNAI